jgi:hypothetical protein
MADFVLGAEVTQYDSDPAHASEVEVRFITLYEERVRAEIMGFRRWALPAVRRQPSLC